MTLSFYNTLTRQKEPLAPHDVNDVRMYVCGPTVYDRAHLGNARSVVVYDVLYRLLVHVYGTEHVNYVRNITDVDDKINKAAGERGITIQALTGEVIGWFHEDMQALNCLSPSHEPKATEYIKDMVAMIEKLIANGHAYVAEGHVLFDVESGIENRESSNEASARLPAPDSNNFKWHYGILSHRALDDLIAGARIEVAPYKKNPGDFVLWKPAAATDDASSKFESPWSVGRPGWHIECSAMATKLLGANFDIHGGGADLMFPHHENEIAQSCCANPGSYFAKTWVHNGFLTVHGEKMSKSLGNFITVRDLLDSKLSPEIIRYALTMNVHYRKPLDWTDSIIKAAESDLIKFGQILDDSFFPKYIHDQKDYSQIQFEYEKAKNNIRTFKLSILGIKFFREFENALLDDLNVKDAQRILHEIVKAHHDKDIKAHDYFSLKAIMWQATELLGITPHSYYEKTILNPIIEEFNEKQKLDIAQKIEERNSARKNKNWALADEIRKELEFWGITLKDNSDGSTAWERSKHYP